MTLHSDVTRARVLFNYAFKQRLIDRPVASGESFNKPSRKVLRLARQRKAPRMFQADEIRRIIGGAGPQLRAMVFLGINCGMGNNDCATLPMKALDLQARWLDFGRPKTGVGGGRALSQYGGQN